MTYNTNKFEDMLFGPLSKNWCNYFYVFSIFFFCSFLLCLIFLLYSLFKKTNRDPLMNMFIIEFLVASFIFYLEKRILHGMCVKSKL